MSSASDPQGPSDASRPRTDQPVPGPEDVVDRALLERVLQQTLLDQTPSTLDPAELKALRGVAEQYRGEPFALEPVALVLVEALLRLQLPAQAARSAGWGGLCSQVAQTLFDDPVSRDRLEAFWVRLSEIER